MTARESGGNVRRMRAVSALVFLLLGCLVSLTPLAQAIPPDPTWIPGIYDDADYDDVVCLVTSGDGNVETGGAAQALSALPAAGRTLAAENDWAPGSPSFSSHSRAPPTS